MKVLVYSDLQSTEGSERLFSDPTQSLQQYRVRLFYKRIRELYEEHDCEGLWDLGDTTDDRSAIPLPTINTVIEGLERFERSQYSFKLIGNHEQFLRNTEVHVGRLFNPYFKVIPKFHEEKIDGLATVLMCSYPNSNAELSTWLEEKLRKRRDEPVIVIGHFQVSGCQMGSGTAVNGVSTSTLRAADLTLLGHIHIPQSLNAKVHYVGSPFQQDFGEANQVKRVGIVDLAEATVKWVQMDGFPAYRPVPLDAFMSTAGVDSEDRFRVSLRNPGEAEAFFAHSLSSRAEPIYSYDASSAEGETVVVPHGEMSMESLMRKYVRANPPSARGIELSEDELVESGKHVSLSQ